MSNSCSHGTLLHFSLQSSHLNICYYHQDQALFKSSIAVYTVYFLAVITHPYSRTFLGRESFKFAVISRSIAWAPSIFRASPFGRWVVTLSLEVDDFQVHLPTVKTDQQRCCNLLGDRLGTLTQRSVNPASPVLLTKNGPLRASSAYNSLLLIQEAQRFLPT